jgi:hypothetical protein
VAVQIPQNIGVQFNRTIDADIQVAIVIGVAAEGKGQQAGVQRIPPSPLEFWSLSQAVLQQGVAKANLIDTVHCARDCVNRR